MDSKDILASLLYSGRNIHFSMLTHMWIDFFLVLSWLSSCLIFQHHCTTEAKVPLSHCLEGYPPREVSQSIRSTPCSQHRWQIITVPSNGTSPLLYALLNLVKTNYPPRAAHWSGEKQAEALCLCFLFSFPIFSLFSIVSASLCFC